MRRRSISSPCTRPGARPATKGCWNGICRRRKAASPGSTNTATATATDSRSTRRARRPATGNMAWKDSGDAVMYPDGSLVNGPKALCELQGYVYNAWIRMAEAFDALGQPGRAKALRAKAAALFERFNDAFWDEEFGFYAYALD